MYQFTINEEAKQNCKLHFHGFEVQNLKFKKKIQTQTKQDVLITGFCKFPTDFGFDTKIKKGYTWGMHETIVYFWNAWLQFQK